MEHVTAFVGAVMAVCSKSRGSLVNLAKAV